MKIGIAAFAALLALAGTCSAGHYVVGSQVSFGFHNVSNNNPTDVQTGVTGLSMVVENLGLNADRGFHQVLFTFINNASSPASVKGIYFDDGSYFSGIDHLYNDYTTKPKQGVWFTDPINGNENFQDNTFNVTAGKTASDDGGLSAGDKSTAYGIDPGERFSMRINLWNVSPYGMVTFDDVIDGLLGLDRNDDYEGSEQYPGIRVGLHVGDFNGGGSESFVNNDFELSTTPVPEPGTLSLVALGSILGGIGYNRRKKSLAVG